jgi:hypothetical protein
MDAKVVLCLRSSGKTPPPHLQDWPGQTPRNWLSCRAEIAARRRLPSVAGMPPSREGALDLGRGRLAPRHRPGRGDQRARTAAPRQPSLEIDPDHATKRRRQVLGKGIFDIGMSLDGFMTAANQRPEEPMGEGGLQLVQWASAVAGGRPGRRAVDPPDPSAVRQRHEDVRAPRQRASAARAPRVGPDRRRNSPALPGREVGRCDAAPSVTPPG